MVIKPGHGLQLSLDLHMRNGSVEMRATLNGGDFNFLSRHWSDLQQQMELRGVRLGPLAGNPQSAGGDTHSSQQQNRNPSEEQAVPQPFADFPLAGVMRAKTITKPITPRGWESWA